MEGCCGRREYSGGGRGTGGDASVLQLTTATPCSVKWWLSPRPLRPFVRFQRDALPSVPTVTTPPVPSNPLLPSRRSLNAPWARTAARYGEAEAQRMMQVGGQTRGAPLQTPYKPGRSRALHL